MTLRLRWLTRDPAGTSVRLASIVGGHAQEVATPEGKAWALRFRGGTLLVTPDDGPVDRLALEAGSADTEAASGGSQLPDPADPRALRGAPTLLAFGWATVDADRAVSEVARALGVESSSFRPSGDDTALGARTRVARAGDVLAILLEPSTEGPIAAALARSGEGPCALYVASAAQASTRPGPLGPAWIAMAERRSGPFVVGVRRRIAAPR